MAESKDVFDVKRELQDAMTAAIDRDCQQHVAGLPGDTTPYIRYLRVNGALVAEVEFYYAKTKDTFYFDLKGDRWTMRRD